MADKKAHFGSSFFEFLEDLKGNRLSGVAAVAVNPHSHWMDQLRDRNVPIVGGGEGFDGGVGLNYGKLVADGVNELLRNGRKRLVLLGNAGRSEFKALLKKRNVPVRPGCPRCGGPRRCRDRSPGSPAPVHRECPLPAPRSG